MATVSTKNSNQFQHLPTGDYFGPPGERMSLERWVRECVRQVSQGAESWNDWYGAVLSSHDPEFLFDAPEVAAWVDENISSEFPLDDVDLGRLPIFFDVEISGGDFKGYRFDLGVAFIGSRISSDIKINTPGTVMFDRVAPLRDTLKITSDEGVGKNLIVRRSVFPQGIRISLTGFLEKFAMQDCNFSSNSRPIILENIRADQVKITTSLLRGGVVLSGVRAHRFELEGSELGSVVRISQCELGQSSSPIGSEPSSCFINLNLAKCSSIGIYETTICGDLTIAEANVRVIRLFDVTFTGDTNFRDSSVSDTFSLSNCRFRVPPSLIGVKAGSVITLPSVGAIGGGFVLDQVERWVELKSIATRQHDADRMLEYNAMELVAKAKEPKAELIFVWFVKVYGLVSDFGRSIRNPAVALVLVYFFAWMAFAGVLGACQATQAGMQERANKIDLYVSQAALVHVVKYGLPILPGLIDRDMLNRSAFVLRGPIKATQDAQEDDSNSGGAGNLQPAPLGLLGFLGSILLSLASTVLLFLLLLGVRNKFRLK